MRSCLFSSLFAALLISMAACSRQVPEKKEATPRGPVPKLVVVAVFDQMKAGYLEQWDHAFSEGGFKRLKREGAWFSECHYPYAYTFTAAGHTTLATGVTPNVHGIIANEWYHRAESRDVESVDPPLALLRQGLGPYRRKAPTVGDQLMGDPNRKGRVFGIAIKDRASILMAALRAFFCYWFELGDFATSPYYGDTRRRWVEEFNRDKASNADRWIGKTWDRFMNDAAKYEAWSGPDQVAAEGVGYDQGNVFPHPFYQGDINDKDVRTNYYKALANSPFGNELLWDFTRSAIENEKIGQGDDTDMLFLGFSSNDYIGHCWGPNSQEVLDVTLRADDLVRRMLDYLDNKVGAGNYVFVVSADHGVSEIPEYLLGQGLKKPGEAGVIPPEVFSSKANDFLNATFAPPGLKLIFLEETKRTNGWVYLQESVLKALRLNPAEVQAKLAAWFLAEPGVEATFTRTQLEGKDPLPGKYAEMVQKSFFPEESGDVFIVAKPNYIIRTPINSKSSLTYRTTHGTPNRYDTHVPLILSGPRLIPGRRDERVSPQILANLLADVMTVDRLPLGMPPPPGVVK